MKLTSPVKLADDFMIVILCSSSFCDCQGEKVEAPHQLAWKILNETTVEQLETANADEVAGLVFISGWIIR